MASQVAGNSPQTSCFRIVSPLSFGYDEGGNRLGTITMEYNGKPGQLPTSSIKAASDDALPPLRMFDCSHFALSGLTKLS